MHPSRLFSLQQKAPVKSAAGLGRGPTLFSVINGQSVISKFGRPFILDSFSPETASRFRSEIRLTFVRSDFATRSGGNRRFRKASESVPRSRSEKCLCTFCSYCMQSGSKGYYVASAFSRENALRFPPAQPLRATFGVRYQPRNAFATRTPRLRDHRATIPRPPPAPVTHARAYALASAVLAAAARKSLSSFTASTSARLSLIHI